MMEKIELAEKISKRLNVPYYIARYQLGNEMLGYDHEWFLFFKVKDLPNKAIRFYNRHHIGFKFNDEFNIFETNIDKFDNKSGRYKVCYRDENGIIYTK